MNIKRSLIVVLLALSGVYGLKILQFTDIHLDILYAVNSHAECVIDVTHMTCCHADNIPVPGEERLASIWGDYNCDVSPFFLEEAFKWMNHTMAKKPELIPDYIVYNGDGPSHHLLVQSKKQNLDTMRNIAELMKKYFSSIPIIPVLGNHDTFPIDQLSFPPPSWLMDPVTEFYKDWIRDEDAIKRFHDRGSYTKLLQPGLRVIVMNDFYHDKQNLHMYIHGHIDDLGDFEWMTKVLEDAEKNNEKVLIMGHMPPGGNEALDWASIEFAKMVRKFHETVKLMVFGHTHRSQFSLLRDQGKVIGTVFIGPSLTSDHVNSGYRYFTLDDSSYELVDIQNWRADLDEIIRTTTMSFSPMQSVLKQFNLKATTPQDWAKFAHDMANSHDTLADYMMQYFNGELQIFDEKFRMVTICEAMFATHDAQKMCEKEGVKSEYWLGTAPFCDPHDFHCEDMGLRVAGYDKCGDGHCCWTGHKIKCVCDDC